MTPFKLLTIDELRFEIARLECRPYNAKAKWAQRLFELRKDLEQREYNQRCVEIEDAFERGAEVRGDGVIVTSDPANL